MREQFVELKRSRCPRCSGEMVLRLEVDEADLDVRLVIDTACVACGSSPWPDSDERLLVFRPGSPGAARNTPEELAAKLASAQARIEQLLRRVEGLDHDLDAARRDVDRAQDLARGRASDATAALRSEVARLEGELAQARAQMRRDEEATHGDVQSGKRPIEIE